MDNADIASEYVDQAMVRAINDINAKKRVYIASAQNCGGNCSRCGSEIPKARLKLVATSLCVECQSAQEHKIGVTGT